MSKKKKLAKRKKPKHYNKQSLTRYISEIFRNNPQSAYNYKQLSKKLDVKDISTKKLITSVLYEMKQAEKIEELYRGKFKLKNIALASIVGKVEMTRRGTAYIVSDELVDDVFVSQGNSNFALHGDTVKVSLFARRRGFQQEGEVVEIIKRARKAFVGTIDLSRNYAFLLPDNSKMPYDIFIPLDKLKKARNGQKVIVEITEWRKTAKNPIGKVVEVLGYAGEHHAEMHAILADFGLPEKFSPEVEAAAERISEKITAEEIAKRRDFRPITTLTIDPHDAKDFDDALSLRTLENGNFEVGIHIADVTHYVKTAGTVDTEAYERGTSVYLVDRTVSMLPERLSNFICSLRPNEDKLCYSAVFEIDSRANVHKQWFGRTVINSNRRFTYEEAQEIIDIETGDFSQEILQLNELAVQLRKRRFQNGAISFNRVEVKFKIDEKGKPLEIYFKEAKPANRLIEEFMLLANRKVAEFVGKARENHQVKTFVYRTHDEPEPDRLGKLSQFVKQFGFQVKTKNKREITGSLNEMLKAVEGTAQQNMIETLTVRTMAKAEYSSDNIGHYGLGFKHYTHFTSPIRRYPDMMVHRLLDRYLRGKQSVDKEQFETYCKHSSERERLAAGAERASIKYKQVEFMADKIGEEFGGSISGVTEWGLYVELTETKIEGMVSIRSIADDYYVFEEKNFQLIGNRTGKTYRIGDAVRVKVQSVNIIKRQLDFVLLNRVENEGA